MDTEIDQVVGLLLLVDIDRNTADIGSRTGCQQSGDGCDGNGSSGRGHGGRPALIGRSVGWRMYSSRSVEHAVLVILVASGARVSDVSTSTALTSHAVGVRLRHVVT